MSHRPLIWKHFSAWLFFRCYHLTCGVTGQSGLSLSGPSLCVVFFFTGKRKLTKMFILTLIWAQVHIFLYTAVGSLVMTFHLRVLCLQTNVPPQDSNNKKSTLPRWEPLNHSLGLLLKLFLTPLVACDGRVAEWGGQFIHSPTGCRVGLGRSSSKGLEFWVPVLLPSAPHHVGPSLRFLQMWFTGWSVSHQSIEKTFYSARKAQNTPRGPSHGVLHVCSQPRGSVRDRQGGILLGT